MEEKRCYGCMKMKTQSPVCEHCGYDERRANAVHQLPAGTVLKEQYMVGRVLGQGGFGITYLGWDLYLDIPVAIKEYYPNGTVMRETSVTMEVVNCSGDAGARFQNNKERFLREAKMLARFSQVPEIVQVKNFFLANNTAYIVMEYVEGITLKQYVREKGGKLSAAETLSILGPVMEALCKVHKAGLVHRDISPDNIMMIPEGGAKLLDFGAVRDVGNASVDKDLTKSTEAILKQGYAPIEQYQKRGALGPWTDVYALCATIYFCLTGEVPADAPERLLMDEELYLEEKVPELTARQRAALEHGLALRADMRIASMDELHGELMDPEPQITAEPIPKTASQPKQTPKAETESRPRTEAKPASKREPRGEKPAAPEKKKKKSPIVLIAMAAVALVAVLAVALGLPGGENQTPSTIFTTDEKGSCGDDMTWRLDLSEGTLHLIGSGDMWDFNGTWMEEEGAQTNPDLTLPPWSEFRDEITALTIDENVTAIGDNAFEECGNLTAIQWGGNLQRIGSMAFRATGLSELTIPDSVTVIDSAAFMDTPLVNVTLSANLETVKSQAFSLCGLLETVTFRSAALLEEVWDNRIFTGDDGSEPPVNLTIICPRGSYAWAYAMHYGIPCEEQGEVAIVSSGDCGSGRNDNVSWTLYDCGVIAIEGEGKMPNYNSGSADGNLPWKDSFDRITLAYFGEGVEYIGACAFADCESLRYVYLPESLEWMGWGVFAGSGLVQIEMTQTCANFDFQNCADLQYVKADCINQAAMYQSSFARCTSLEKLVLGPNVDIPEPDTYSDIFTDASSKWQGKENYPVPENLVIYGAPGSDAEEMAEYFGFPFVPQVAGCHADESGQTGEVNWLLDREKKTLVLYGKGKTAHYDVSQNEYAEFHEFRDDIEHVIITTGVTGLGSYLFRDLTGLKDVETYSHWWNSSDNTTPWTDHAAIASLGEGLFSGCTSLESFIIPLSVRSYGIKLFENCTSLRAVGVFWGTLPANTFAGCHSLEKVFFHTNSNFAGDVFGSDDGHDYTEHVTFYVWKGRGAWSNAKKSGIPYVENTMEG